MDKSWKAMDEKCFSMESQLSTDKCPWTKHKDDWKTMEFVHGSHGVCPWKNNLKDLQNFPQLLLSEKSKSRQTDFFSKNHFSFIFCLKFSI